MRFLKRLAIGLALLVAAFAVVVWMQPDCRLVEDVGHVGQ